MSTGINSVGGVSTGAVKTFTGVARAFDSGRASVHIICVRLQQQIGEFINITVDEVVVDDVDEEESVVNLRNQLEACVWRAQKGCGVSGCGVYGLRSTQKDAWDTVV